MANHRYVVINNRTYNVSIYESGDPIMPNDGLLGMDAETERFKNKYEYPPMVIFGVCSGSNVQLIPWRLADEYLDRLYEDPNVKTALFNAGFDTGVLGFKRFVPLLDNDRVYELKDNYAIYKIAEKGWYNPGCTLASCALEMCGIVLTKDDDVRLHFYRDTAPTIEQLDYLAADCVATYELALKLRGQPTEFLQARSSICLDHISRRGMLVDREFLTSQIMEKKEHLEDANDRLQAFGLYLDSASKYTAVELLERLAKFADIQGAKNYLPPKGTTLNKTFWKMMAGRLLTVTPEAEGMYDLQVAIVQMMKLAEKFKEMTKEEMEADCRAVDRACAIHGTTMCLKTTRAEPWKTLCWLIVEEYSGRHRDEWEKRTWERFYKLHEENLGWLQKTDNRSPQMIMQEYLASLEARTPGLTLPRTKGGKKRINKKIKLSSKDKWILEDFQINDAMLTAWFEYKHTEKLLSTYLTEKYIGDDGRVHPRFTNMVRTGRTACSGPNLQNPAKEFGVRECYIPRPGYVYVSIDYNQLELCALAEICLTRYGFSRMATLINAGIHLHRWFSAYRMKWLTKHTYDGTPESVEVIKKIFEKVEKSTLLLSKAGNFGQDLKLVAFDVILAA